jgi:hypothetical protein
MWGPWIDVRALERQFSDDALWPVGVNEYW